MANIETKFYVARGYYVRSASMLGDSAVHGSICDDSEAGKSAATARAKELQGWNDEERKTVRPKKSKQKV